MCFDGCVGCLQSNLYNHQIVDMATSRARTVRRDGSQSDNGNSGSGAADVMKQSRKDGCAVCLETWRLPGELFREDLETRRAAVEVLLLCTLLVEVLCCCCNC